jgi:hypothetical protein
MWRIHRGSVCSGVEQSGDEVLGRVLSVVVGGGRGCQQVKGRNRDRGVLERTGVNVV